MAFKAAVRHTWEARRVVVDPFGTFLFFRRGLNGDAATAYGPFRLPGGIRFYARFLDWAAVQEVALAQEYGFIRSLLPGGAAPKIVDVGANIGMFSMYALSLWPQATVYAVEPSRRTFELLQRNRRANARCAWQVFRYAVWSGDGEVRFENRRFSTSSRVGDATTGDELVPAIGLPALLSRLAPTPVDLLKMDVEGAEEAALCGHEALLRDVAHLVVEVHPQLCDHDRVVACLRSAYDHLYRIPGRGSDKPLLLATRRPQPWTTYGAP